MQQHHLMFAVTTSQNNRVRQVSNKLKQIYNAISDSGLLVLSYTL